MTEQNKREMRRFYDEVVNQGQLDLIDELLAEDFVEHEVFPGMEPTRAGVKQFFTLIRQAFPDLRFEAEDLIAEGEKVVGRARMTGTHEGEFMGIPATGRSIDVQVIDIVEFRDGLSIAHWGVSDALTMMQQLGAIPAPAAAAG